MARRRGGPTEPPDDAAEIPTGDARVVFLMPSAWVARLDACAEARLIDRSSYIRQALADWIRADEARGQ